MDDVGAEGSSKVRRLSERSMGSNDNPWSGDEGGSRDTPKSADGSANGSLVETPGPKGILAEHFHESMSS